MKLSEIVKKGRLKIKHRNDGVRDFPPSQWDFANLVGIPTFTISMIENRFFDIKWENGNIGRVTKGYIEKILEFLKQNDTTTIHE